MIKAHSKKKGFFYCFKLSVEGGGRLTVMEVSFKIQCSENEEATNSTPDKMIVCFVCIGVHQQTLKVTPT